MSDTPNAAERGACGDDDSSAKQLPIAGLGGEEAELQDKSQPETTEAESEEGSGRGSDPAMSALPLEIPDAAGDSMPGAAGVSPDDRGRHGILASALERVAAQPQASMAVLAFIALLWMGVSWTFFGSKLHSEPKENAGVAPPVNEKAEMPAGPVVPGTGENAPVTPEEETPAEPKPWIIPSDQPRLVLIIDDWGNYLDETDAAFLALPVPITASVIPHLPQSESDARKVARAGLDVMLHLPMEPESDVHVEREEITVGMPDNKIKETVQRALRSVPGAVAVNNHQGSKATADTHVMQVVLSEVNRSGLFFVDSRTTAATVIPNVAAEMGINFLERATFLDGQSDAAYIRGQLLQAAEEAKEKGFAVAIGHVHPETVKALAQSIPEVQQMGIRFVKLSELVRLPTSSALAEAEQLQQASQKTGQAEANGGPADESRAAGESAPALEPLAEPNAVPEAEASVEPQTVPAVGSSLNPYSGPEADVAKDQSAEVQSDGSSAVEASADQSEGTKDGAAQAEPDVTPEDGAAAVSPEASLKSDASTADPGVTPEGVITTAEPDATSDATSTSQPEPVPEGETTPDSVTIPEVSIPEAD